MGRFSSKTGARNPPKVDRRPATGLATAAYPGLGNRARLNRPARWPTRPRLSENHSVATDEIIDQLYGLPLAQFTQARNQAASELRRAGRHAEANQVKALRKPSAAAAAINRLVREHRHEVEAFLQTAATLRDAQFAGKGDLQAASKDEREALERLTRAGGEPVRQSLLAAAVDEQAARELLAGRLEHELEPRGFGTLLAHVRPATRPTAAQTKAKSTAPARKQPDDRAARAKLQNAKATLTAAQADERQAQRQLTQTQRQVETAKAAVNKAQHDLDNLHGR